MLTSQILAIPNNPVNSNENSLLQVKLDAALETIERLEADWKQQARSLARFMPPDRAGECARQKRILAHQRSLLTRFVNAYDVI